jgi:hypothetical protein
VTDYFLMKTAWHYCSTRSLLGIVQTEKFWLSNIFFMNDSAEFLWAKRLALEDINARARASAGEVDYLCQLKELLVRSQFVHVYCGSFSASGDDLSQWRGYASGGSGVAIEVDIDSLDLSYELLYEAVEYNYEEQKARMAGCVLHGLHGLSMGVSPVDVAASAYNFVSMLAPMCKHPSFASEREYRIVFYPVYTGTSTCPIKEWKSSFEGRDWAEPGFYERNNMLVPYVAIPFSRRAIRQVRLGPRYVGEREMDAVRLLLSMYGMTDASVSKSESTYR